MRLESATSQYDEIGERDACDAMYNAVFLQNGGNSKMATDSEFRAAIKTAPIYLTNKELVHFLLYAIELSDREARKTIPDFDAASTVEHIMPQPVSYTHLDVYKRQNLFYPSSLNISQNRIHDILPEHLIEIIWMMATCYIRFNIEFTP